MIELSSNFSVLAQSCVMCKSAAAAQLASALRSLNIGIVVLLVPPVAIMGAILAVAFHRRRE